MGPLIYAILTSLGSTATVITLVRDLSKKRDGMRIYILIGVSLFLAVLAGALWSNVNNLKNENILLKSARIEANKLAESWPNTDRIEFISRGQARGIVLSGLAFLETHKEQFPDTYMQSSYLVKNFEINKNNDEEWFSEIGELQQAAETMIILINSIRVKEK